MNLKTYFTAVLFATALVTACGGSEESASESDSALSRGSGPRGNAYSCTNGTCTCDKAIENDCEDMSGVCTDATVDALINCINGWLTTHCTCTKAVVRSTTQPHVPLGGVFIGR